MSEANIKELNAHVEQAIAHLMEKFSTAIIMVTYKPDSELDQTSAIVRSEGNYFANVGVAKCWVNSKEREYSASTKSDDPYCNP